MNESEGPMQSAFIRDKAKTTQEVLMIDLTIKLISMVLMIYKTIQNKLTKNMSNLRQFHYQDYY